MKVAVSIPAKMFAEAEDLAKKLNASRSEIYSRALGEFLSRHAPERVTESLNAIDALGEKPDDFTRRAARRVVRKVDW